MRGVYHHNIDVKGRLNFPVKFRDELGECFILTKGLNQCLWAMSEDEFERIEEKIAELPVADAQQLQYYFAANYDVETDAQGRILVNPELRTFAGLEKEVTLIGYKNRVELWNTATWKSVSEMSPRKALDLLGDIRLF